MSDGMSFDFSELSKLAADIDVAANVGPFAKKAVTVTARNVKDAWRDKLKGSETLPALPYAVSYDVEVDDGAIAAEVGFDLSKAQGPLGGISEFGTPTTPPRGYGHGALEENQADFKHGLEQAAADAMGEAGL